MGKFQSFGPLKTFKFSGFWDKNESSLLGGRRLQCEDGGGSNISVVCEIASCEECVEKQNKELYGAEFCTLRRD
jgi:hypothetical protein